MTSSFSTGPSFHPVLTSGQGLFPVVPDSTLSRFVNNQLVASCQLGFLISFRYFQIVSLRLLKWSTCELATSTINKALFFNQ